MTFEEHLKKYLTDDEIASLISSFDNKDKHAALLNISKMDDETFISLFPNVLPHPIVKHAYLYSKDEYDLGKSVYHDLGCFYLQEPSAMIPSFLLSPNKGDVVLDLCAAPGGKSVQASLLMENDGLIISNDLSKDRAFSIIENIERLGLGNIIVTNNDFSTIHEKFNNFFDKIIIDAPCSGSGMFRKDSKMKDDWSFGKVLKFSSIQKELITYCYSMLKEGGIMVYSTCSYSFEEDEEVIDYLLKNTGAELIKIENSDKYYVSNKLGYGIHLFPSIFDGEGHYICLIKKPGTIVKSKINNQPLPKKYQDLEIDNRLHHFDDFNEVLFALPMHVNLPKGLNILRKGIKVLEWNKNYYRYEYHYSHYISNFSNIFRLDEDNLKKYIKGYQLDIASTRGHILLKYKNINVAFGKSDGSHIKNYYPKGIRH